LITIVKDDTNYKVHTKHGSFDLKKENGCFVFDSADPVVNQIEEFRKVPKNSCLYTIENKDIKFIFYQSHNDFIIVASAYREVYMEDGFVMKSPLQIIDEKRARVSIAALTSIDMIEIEKSKHTLCLNIGIHKFCTALSHH